MFKKLYAALFFSLSLIYSSYIYADYHDNHDLHDKSRHELIKIIVHQQQTYEYERAKAAFKGVLVGSAATFVGLALLDMHPKIVMRSFFKAINPF